MIINQILAVVWIVICCVCVFWAIRYLPTILELVVPESERSEWVIVFTVSFVVDLIGMAASVLLLHGVTWARWLIGLVAIWTAIRTSHVDRQRPFGISATIMFIVSLMTLVLLLCEAVKIFW